MNLSVRDVCRLLGVTEETVYRWIKESVIPSYRIQGQVLFDRAEILEWATARGHALAPRIFQAQAASDSPQLGRLAAALAAGGVHAGVAGEDRPSALRSVVDRLPLPEGADKGLLLEMLLARENLGSTAMGRGIAIPHPRFPLILSPSSEILALCFLENPIDFQAPDGLPVGILFVLITAGAQGHLALLSRLAFVLRDRSALDLLDRRAGLEVLLETFTRIEASMEARTS